ncbi:epidermal growth factor-like protein 7 isoform X2 [Tenrec ecaudatus]|uniref:epidermal growth factor-like protein 7 isoform X2 n=1 Tax=Tenrec ecaudatus TaxID=94439 RepID=UPI003F5A7D8F
MAAWDSRELLLLSLLVLAAGGTDHTYRPSRRVCAVSAPGGEGSESFVQRIYQPFLTTCDGHRVCSTYRTIYRTAYRRSPGPAPARPRYACCPGWKRMGGLPGACGADVDECRFGRGSCPQHCVNTAGSYQCQCREGHHPSTDGTLCVPMRGPPTSAPCPKPGGDRAVQQEVQSLQSRVAMLEQKLQLVLAPLDILASRALQLGLPDAGSLLLHSLQQLERIDSLSEQISLLEEQLGACSCKQER